MAKRVRRAQGRPAGGSEEIVRGILQATLRLLETRGYADVRVEEVALAAGVNKTSVYRRWPSKGELVVAALKARGDEEPPFVESGDLRLDLVSLLTVKAARLATPRGLRILRAVMALGEQTSAELSRAFPEGRFGRPRALLEHAIERGALPPRTDAHFLTELLLAPILQRILVLHLPVDQAFVTRVVDHVLGGSALEPPRGPRAARPTRTR